MPVLNRGWFDRNGAAHDAPAQAAGTETEPRWISGRDSRVSLLQTCSNPRCRSGWLHLWRSRSAPVFEGGWSCSPECTEERIRRAVRRELDGPGGARDKYRHRVPLGLLMMEQGWITADQQRKALQAQKSAGGRFGEWLIRQEAVSEQLVTRALSLQWSCPVLSVGLHKPEALSALMPRLFLDVFRALPLRVAAGKVIYLGFEERLDPVLALALERMTGLQVESGLVPGSEFGPAHERMLSCGFPPLELLGAVSETVLVRALTRAVEKARPVESRLVRVHDCLWLRMWNSSPGPLPALSSVADLIASIDA